MSNSLYDLSYFDGASAVVVMVSYYDASEIGDHLAIGGLLFRKKNIKPFEKEWRAMLRKHGLTHFHMTDCNAGEGEYKTLERDERDASAREAIRLIIKYATKGVIFSVSKTDFAEIIGSNGFMPNPFTLGAWYSLFDTRYYADTNDTKARIAYVFESGDDHQSDAENLLTGISEEPTRAESFYYYGHAFLPKRTSLPTQAADILAWHGAKQADRVDRGHERLRGDFQEIVTKLHVSNGRHEREWLHRLVATTRRLQDKDIGGRRIKPEHWDEYVRLSFLMNRGNAHQALARAKELLEPHEGEQPAQYEIDAGNAD